MSERTFKAMVSPSLSIGEPTLEEVMSGIFQNPEDRYVIVSMETGEILDDAQGYGYRSAPAAYKAYGWKQNHGKKSNSEKTSKVVSSDV